VNGVQDDGETEGLDEKRVDTAGVVGDIVIDQRGVIVSVTVPNRGEVAFNEGPEDGGVLSGRGSGVGFEGNNRRARGWEDELEFGEVVGSGFVGVRRGGEVVKAGFGGIGGAEGRRVDLAVGEEKEVDERAEFGEVPASCVTPGKFAEERVFGKNWVKGIGVGVWGGEDPVEPNRGGVRGDEVVSISVLNVVMGLGDKAFEGGKFGKRIGRFETRRPEHVEMGHEGWVVEGREREFEGVTRGEDGEKIQADGHVRIELLLAQKGVAGDEGSGGKNSAVSFREVGVDAVEAGGAR
jgi:hypothetical protein